MFLNAKGGKAGLGVKGDPRVGCGAVVAGGGDPGVSVHRSSAFIASKLGSYLIPVPLFAALKRGYGIPRAHSEPGYRGVALRSLFPPVIICFSLPLWSST